MLALFEQEARRVLADHPVNRERRARGVPVANAVLTRGAGHLHRLMPPEYGGTRLRVACVSGDRTVLGIASYLGADVVSRPEMTANLDTDVVAKFAAAAQALEHHDLVVVHLKGADIASHDRRPDLKVEFLERIDTALGELLAGREEPLRVAVAADHTTLSEAGHHAADPVPVLSWGPGIPPDAVRTFSERTAAGGGLGQFPLQLLLARLFEPD